MIKRAPNNVRCLGQFGEHILTRRLPPVTPSGPPHCDAERSRWPPSRERCQQEVGFSWPWSFFEAGLFHLGVGSLPTPVVTRQWRLEGARQELAATTAVSPVGRERPSATAR